MNVMSLAVTKLLPPSAYAGQPRDSVRERRMAEELRRMAPDEAFAFIWEYLDHDPIVALVLANRVLRRKEDLQRVLRRGIATGDASSVRWWIESCLPRLGARGCLRVLEEVARIDPEAVRRALYWARILIHEASPASLGQIRALERLLEGGGDTRSS